MLDLKERLEFAREATTVSGPLILGYYQDRNLVVELKRDRSVVTEADRNAELKLRELIRKAYPDDGIVGEEFGAENGDREFCWVLDPVDGTQSFVCGVPLFGTLIGLTYRKKAVLGVVHFPALNELYFGSLGGGAWWTPRNATAPVRAAVSAIADPKEALFSTTSLSGFEQAGCMDVYERLSRASGKLRGWSDCYGHMLVATGRAEIMVDPLMNLWDNAALFPIVTEAGGHFVDLKGDARIDGGSGISTNGALFEHYRRLLVARH